MLKKLRLLFSLILILIGVSLWGDSIPLEAKSFFYALSLSMKQVLLFVIPFVIFSFLFHSLISQREGAVMFVVLLVVLVYCSNLVAILTSYFVSSQFLSYINMPNLGSGSSVQSLEPMWVFKLKPLIRNEIALMAGFICGIFFFFWRSERANKIAHSFNAMATGFLKYGFIPFLPLFILGFVIQLQHEKVLSKVLSLYGPLFLLVAGLQLSYLAIYYAFAAGFSPKKWVDCVRNIMPASFTAFTSMSSIATMPVTIVCTEQNVKSSNFAKLIIPSTVNIHTIGSAIGVVALTLATTMALGKPMPTLEMFLPFALFWAMAKFSVAAVPGGAVIVAMPLLEHFLGADGAVVSLVAAAYTFFDPLGTMTNVTGNGAFAIVFSKIPVIRTMIASEIQDETDLDDTEDELSSPEMMQSLASVEVQAELHQDRRSCGVNPGFIARDLQ
jgi:Na+/H+-dicarboxylate symporter